jgi:putative SOS response-associated peptidase YedK
VSSRTELLPIRIKVSSAPPVAAVDLLLSFEWRCSKWLLTLPALEPLVPYDATAMEAYPVSLRVNRPANDTPDIIEPLAS